MPTLPPVDHTVNVPLAPAEAFALFTTQMQKWWPLSTHSCSRSSAATMRFEPRAGGRVIELAPDGQEHTWGTLLEWDPPHGLVMTWHPAQQPPVATRLAVSFTARGASTDVRIVHDSWEARGDGAADVRAEYERGWPMVMAAFVRAVSEVQTPRPPRRTP